MRFISFSRLPIIAAFLCACLVPLTRAYADDWDDCKKAKSQPDLAIRSCTAVINAGKETPLDLALMHQYRGIAYNKTGQHDAAMTDFNRAIALDPNFAQAYQSRAARFEAQGLKDLAIRDFRKSLELKPGLGSSGRTYSEEALRRLGAASAPAPSTAAPVAPSCPSGYVLSQGQCVRAAASTPAPSCPTGFVFSQGKCMQAAAPTAPPVRRALPPAYQAQPPIRTAPRPAPRVNLPLELQKELKRIGCYTGGLDGDWGRGSQSALQRFSNQAGLRLGTQPSQQAIDEAKRTQAGYCQPIRVAPKRTAPKRKKTTGCRSGTVFLEGQCIPRSQVAEFCGPGFEWRGGSKCVSMSGGGQQAGGGCLSKCESRLKSCQRNVNRSEDEVICLNKFESCSNSC